MMSRLDFEKPELSLLTLEDVQGDSKLEVFEKYGLEAQLTDLALLTGGAIRSEKYYKIGSKGDKKIVVVIC